jgi:hypothetical protein
MVRSILMIALALLPALALAQPASAQGAVAGADTLAVADTIPHEARVPRGAFVRALLVPGWGHAYIDEPRRGAIFFALQATSGYMLLRTMSRLENARDVEDRIAGFGRDSLHAAMAADTALARQLSNPDAFEAELGRYPGLANARGLVSARERHRQDWIVYTLVLTFGSAVDAYVTAHLKDFPGDIMAVPAPGGGVTMRLQLPVGRAR